MTMGAVPEPAAELLRLGLEQAARSLTAFSGLETAIAVEGMALEPPWRLPPPAAEPEAQVVGIYVGFLGDLRGHCLLTLDAVRAGRLADRLLGGAPAPEAVRESALLEFGNIAVSGVVNAIADRGGWLIGLSPPVLARDTVAALVNSVLAAASAEHREVLAVRGRLRVGELELWGTILLLPDARSLQELLHHPTAP